ncbi:MAG: glycosyltransferase, partial [Anaerolineales bacterium]|nr:glycosyltransferase [Anaerolineales bacterium]
PRLLAALRAVLAAERPHLVHLQHLMGLPFAVAGAIRAAGIPFVVTLHDYWYGCANAQLITNDTQEICAGPDARFHNCGRCALARAGLPGQTWLAPAVAPLLQQRHRQTNRVLRSAAAVIAPTRFIRDTYRQMGLPADRIVVIPHGIEPPSDAAALRARAAARPPDAPLHLGYVGSLGWQKGLHVLVEAVNPLPPDRVRLSLYGGLDAFPDYVAGLQRQAAHPGIRFMGRIPRAALWTALADLDLLVVPTLWYEAFSLVVDEAFAVGVPVLASDIGVMPERIRHGQDGLLFPPGDAAALRAILQRLLANPAELAALRAHIRPVRTLAEHLADLDAVYSRLQ